MASLISRWVLRFSAVRCLKDIPTHFRTSHSAFEKNKKNIRKNWCFIFPVFKPRSPCKLHAQNNKAKAMKCFGHPAGKIRQMISEKWTDIFPPGNESISHQTGKGKIIDSKVPAARGYVIVLRRVWFIYSKTKKSRNKNKTMNHWHCCDIATIFCRWSSTLLG